MNCFSGLDTSDEAYVSVRNKLIEIEGEIDRPTRNRRKTDGNYIYVMAGFFALVACMLIYCGAIGGGSTRNDGNDRNRRQIRTEFDNFNSPTPMPQLELDYVAYMAMITIVLVLATLMLLRYFIGPFIWALLAIAVVAFSAVSIGFWVMFFNVKNKTHGVILLPIVTTVVTAVIIFLIYATRRRIQMIIQVFKEAGKAIGDMPQLFIQPAISLVAVVISGAAYMGCIFVIFRAGMNAYGVYNPDDIVVCTYLFLGWTAIWLVYFYKGCQSMIIGGCVATWYFRRNKSNLGTPMWTSTINLVRYHLGTVAFGSLLMLLMEITKAIVNFFTKRRATRICCCCCACICCMLKNFFKYFERILKYFTKMAYIMTAIHSVPFCTGGREAIHLLVQQAFSLLQLKCFCVFVLGVLQLILVMAVVGICFVIDPQMSPLVFVFSGLFAFYTANSFLNIYNIAIDTIFLCYCEDIAENDGVTKPYFMSRELMSFINDCMRTLGSIVRDFMADQTQPPKRENEEDASAPALGPV